MEQIKAFMSWLFFLGVSIVTTPWMIVMGVKLAFWPHLLTDCEAETILAIKGEKEELAALKVIGDFVAICVLSWLSPLWLGVFLWIALVVNYLFMWQVKALVLEEKEEVKG